MAAEQGMHPGSGLRALFDDSLVAGTLRCQETRGVLSRYRHTVRVGYQGRPAGCIQAGAGGPEPGAGTAQSLVG